MFSAILGTLPTREVRRRIDRVQRELRDADTDALILVDRSNIFYLTGIQFYFQSMDLQLGVWQSMVITKKNAFLIVYERARSLIQQQGDIPIIEYSSKDGSIASIAASLPNAKLIGIEEDLAPYFIYSNLAGALRETRLVPGGRFIQRARLFKSEYELNLMKRSEAIASEGMRKAIETVRPGAREIDVAMAAEKIMFANGAEDLAFKTKVASGPRAGQLSALATKRRIHANDTVIIDLGCVSSGYCSDLTRTVTVGRLNSKLEDAKRAVIDTRHRILRELSPGTNLSALRKFVENEVEEAGFAEHLYHPSHGIGIDTVEAPTQSRCSDEPLTSGAALMLEFSINLKGKGGYGFEDMLFFRSSSIDLVSKLPIE
jgi:Xaa-Pro aminopeptidase